MRKNIWILTVIMAIASVTACKKKNDVTGNTQGNSNMTVRMTDAPGPYDSVVVYVERIEINRGDSLGWDTLNTKAGYYDLLRLQGTDTVLVDSAGFPAGYIGQMRMILKEGANYVVDTTGVKTFLTLSSQDKTGLKLNLNTTVVAGKSYELLIDFDALKSIVVQGNGKLRLKPVLKTVSLKQL